MRDNPRPDASEQYIEDIDAAFGVLADGHRRRVLACLRETEGTVALVDLAREVAVRTAETPLGEVSSDAVRQVYLELYHTHLPKLAEMGAVEFDADHNSVRQGPAFAEFVALVDEVE